MGYEKIRKYPLLRLLIPLIGGILIGEELYDVINIRFPVVFYLIFFLSLLWIFLWFVVYKTTFTFLFGLLLIPFLVTLGFIRFSINQSPKYDDVFATSYMGTIIEPPTSKAESSFCNFTIRLKQSDDKVLLYIPKSNFESKDLIYSVGDCIAFYGKIKQPKNKSVLKSFNYATYLMRQGLSGICYTTNKNCTLLGKEDLGWWSNAVITQRDRLMRLFRKLNFEGEVLAIASALTIGTKEYLTEDLRLNYTKAGVSHVLALSGLHLGVIYLFIFTVLSFILYKLSFSKELATVIACISVWFFALFTGSSPSIIRSALLFSLLGVGTLFNRKKVSINSLSVVAFFMLLYNPNWLFSISFQLSFSAVASILLFTKPLQSLIRTKNKTINYIWSLLVVSFTAQLGTTPWVLFHFGTFSPYFLLTNMIVVPLITLLIYSLLLLILFGGFDLFQLVLSKVVVCIINSIHEVIDFVVSLPQSYIESLTVYPVELIVVLVISGVLLLCYHIKRKYFIMTILVSIGLVISCRLFYLLKFKPQDRIDLYLVRDRPVLQVTNVKGDHYVVLVDTLVKEEEVIRVFTKQWSYQQLKNPEFITTNRDLDLPYWYNGLFSYRGISLLFVNSSLYCKADKILERIKIDYLYLFNTFKGELESLFSLYDIGTLIASHRLMLRKESELTSLCILNNVSFITLDEKGYLDLLR